MCHGRRDAELARQMPPGTPAGQRRWKIKRTIAWIFGYRRLTVRYERHGRLFTAVLTLAATLTCYKKLA